MTTSPADRLAEIRARAAAATPGPWGWRGNIDYGCPSLRARHPKFGITDVLTQVSVERTADDPALQGIEDYDADTRAEIIENYLRDHWGEPIKEQHLAFVTDDMLVEARQLVEFEVAPNATTRKDPKVYRADIVGIRHPDAEFIAAARADIDWLIAEVDRLRETTGGQS
jgi:hypothetical protein